MTPSAPTKGNAFVEYIRSLNPVLKRFLKGIIATALAGLVTRELSYVVTFLTANPTAFGGVTAIITGAILAIEKSIPNNL